MKSKKEQSKEEEVITEHCRVIPHAPCPPHRGAGGLTTPKGVTTARPSFRAVPQRAVDIIWRCAGGDQHNAVCWVCAGFVLGLCQVCAGVVLGLCWVCAGVVLLPAPQIAFGGTKEQEQE